MIIFSLNSIPQRKNNLNAIIPKILKQCDILYVNLIGYSYDQVPEILKNNDNKIKVINVKYFYKGGSELKFYNYNDCGDDDYYFTIDDDILYPDDYAETIINKMKQYSNSVICCVHGSIIDLSLNENFYKKNRIVYHFKQKLTHDTRVMIPGSGTSCFCKKNFSINLEDFKISNMADIYIASFAYKQNIPIICIERNEEWLKPLPEYGKKIYGNNPYKHIDEVIIQTFKNNNKNK